MVDQILARATQLSDEDLFTLTQALNAENSKRMDMRQSKDWQRVVDAIDNYIGKWGEIVVLDNDNGNTIYIGESGTYTATSLGEIEIGG